MAPLEHPVVALVGSAGGLAAVGAILETLPEDLPATVLVLLHQAPGHVGHIPEILQRQCALPVAFASQGAELAPGRVWVAPSGEHLLVTPQGTLALVLSGVFPPSRPSADLLLVTLATACRGRAVAVVLSGNGHDGATGATAVHDFGGTVLASDEATTEVFAMADATIHRDDAIDHVLPLGDIAAKLVAIAASDDARLRVR